MGRIRGSGEQGTCRKRGLGVCGQASQGGRAQGGSQRAPGAPLEAPVGAPVMRRLPREEQQKTTRPGSFSSRPPSHGRGRFFASSLAKKEAAEVRLTLPPGDRMRFNKPDSSQ